MTNKCAINETQDLQPNLPPARSLHNPTQPYTTLHNTQRSALAAAPAPLESRACRIDCRNGARGLGLGLPLGFTLTPGSITPAAITSHHALAPSRPQPQTHPPHTHTYVLAHTYTYTHAHSQLAAQGKLLQLRGAGRRLRSGGGTGGSGRSGGSAEWRRGGAEEGREGGGTGGGRWRVWRTRMLVWHVPGLHR